MVQHAKCIKKHWVFHSVWHWVFHSVWRLRGTECRSRRFVFWYFSSLARGSHCGPPFLIILAPFWFHLGVPKLVILGSISGSFFESFGAEETTAHQMAQHAKCIKNHWVFDSFWRLRVTECRSRRFVFLYFSSLARGSLCGPTFSIFLALFWLHLGVPKLVILELFFGPPNKSAPKTRRTGRHESGARGEHEEST